MRNDRQGITTATACILVVLLVGTGMLAFNEYERTTLRQQALTQNTSDIIVGDYKYTFSNVTKIPNMPPHTTTNINEMKLWGDRVVFYAGVSGYAKIMGYNLTSGSTFTLRSLSNYYGISHPDMNGNLTSWCEDTIYSDQEYAMTAYVWSNGTIYQAPHIPYGGQNDPEVTTVCVGDSVYYAPWWNNMNSSGINIYKWDSVTWQTTILKHMSIAKDVVLTLEASGKDDELLYKSSNGIFRLNVETLAETPICNIGSASYAFRTINSDGIWDDACAYMDFASLKFKITNFKRGTTQTIDNVTNVDYRYPYNQLIDIYDDKFCAYFILPNANQPSIRFYDAETDARFQLSPQINLAYAVGAEFGNSCHISNKYVVMNFYYSDETYYYTYARTDYNAPANHTNQTGTHSQTNQTSQTSLEKAQDFLSSNWIYIAIIGGVTAVVAYFAYRKFRSEPKYREQGAKRNINWGLIVSIGVIALIAILFML